MTHVLLTSMDAKEECLRIELIQLKNIKTIKLSLITIDIYK